MGTIDGTTWSTVTIDGDPVQEITMDGDTVWTATHTYDFETGDTSKWTSVNDLSVSATRVYEGSYSGHTNSAQYDTYQAYVIPQGYDSGQKPDKFEFYWLEYEDESKGGSIRLFNSNGNYEIGLATNNPQWHIDDGTGVNTVYNGDGYDRWVKYTIMFNWDNGTFDVHFEDMNSGSTYTDSGRPLRHGTDIRKIQIDDYNSGDYQVGDSSTTSDPLYMFFDNIKIGRF